MNAPLHPQDTYALGLLGSAGRENEADSRDWSTSPIQVSIFKDVKAKTIDRQAMSWGDLKSWLQDPPEHPSKSACPLLKLATFGDTPNRNGALRYDANMLEIHGVEGDYDDEQISIEAAAALLETSGIEAFLYTTPSHQPHRPRWRVLAPLSRPYSKAERTAYVTQLNNALGGTLAKESYTASQAYYCEKVRGVEYETRCVRGMPLDLLSGCAGDIGDETPIPPPETAATAEGVSIHPGELSESVLDDLRSALKQMKSDDRELWVRMGHALKTLGEAGRGLWLEWSATSEKFDPERDEATWDSFKPERTDYKAVLAEAQRQGWVNTWSSAVSPQDQAILEHLAALSPLEYDRARKAEAKTLRVRESILDKLVEQARKTKGAADTEFDAVMPWPGTVEPAALLSEISATVRRFIVCPPETADAAALWATMTWFMDAVQVAPLAVITAPEKRCGKSQLLSVLGRLVCRPLAASNISPAALFRSIDMWKPTLLVDEADAFMRENEELRGLLNCGHTRDSAYVVRTVGEDFTPTKFNVWGAKALAGIGHMADTLMDRAVILELRRKLPYENVERLRHAETGLFDDLAAKLARLAEDYQDAIRSARPELPASLNDRAQDNWEPLLAIADVAGGYWPDLARKAALKLSGEDSPSMSIGTELLADIQEVFEHQGVDRISSAGLIAALCNDDEKPWATHNRGKPLNPRLLSRRLAEYGIKSATIRIGAGTVKGYMREWLEEAFSRYLTSPANPNVTTSQPSNDGVSSVTDGAAVTVTSPKSVTPEPAPLLGCYGVTDAEGDMPDNDNTTTQLRLLEDLV